MTKVLLVSSDNTSKKIIDRTLSHTGLTVFHASGFVPACRRLTETLFDFIMIDMQLDGESGLALYKSLRQIGNNIPVMMIGEGKLDLFILQDMAIENYDFILKPILFDELKLKVKAFLEQKLSQVRILSFGELRIDSRQQLLMFKDKLLQGESCSTGR